MASDREARALGAGQTIEVNGAEYRLRSVVAQHLCDLERDALRHFKRQYLQTYRENADLLGDGNGQVLMQGKFEEVARWDLNDLPQKTAYDVSRLPVTDELKRWIADSYGEGPETEGSCRAMIANALDTDRITAERVRELCGKAPLCGRVRYDQWWVTASMTGMVAFIASSLRREHPEVTRDTVAQWPFNKIAEAARIVESLTSAAVGNI